MRIPFARSTALRVASRSPRSAISASSACTSSQRERAMSMAGMRSAAVNGLTT